MRLTKQRIGCSRSETREPRRGRCVHRRAAASLDYVLIVCIVLPLVAVIMAVVRPTLDLASQWMQALIAWPFL